MTGLGSSLVGGKDISFLPGGLLHRAIQNMAPGYPLRERERKRKEREGREEGGVERRENKERERPRRKPQSFF